MSTSHDNYSHGLQRFHVVGPCERDHLFGTEVLYITPIVGIPSWLYRDPPTGRRSLFVSKFVSNAIKHIGGSMVSLGINNETVIGQAIAPTGANLITDLKGIPGIAGNETAYAMVVRAGQVPYAESYGYVYLASIAAGGDYCGCVVFGGGLRVYG